MLHSPTPCAYIPAHDIHVKSKLFEGYCVQLCAGMLDTACTPHSIVCTTHTPFQVFPTPSCLTDGSVPPGHAIPVLPTALFDLKAACPPGHGIAAVEVIGSQGADAEFSLQLQTWRGDPRAVALPACPAAAVLRVPPYAQVGWTQVLIRLRGEWDCFACRLRIYWTARQRCGWRLLVAPPSIVACSAELESTREHATACPVYLEVVGCRVHGEAQYDQPLPVLPRRGQWPPSLPCVSIASASSVETRLVITQAGHVLQTLVIPVPFRTCTRLHAAAPVHQWYRGELVARECLPLASPVLVPRQLCSPSPWPLPVVFPLRDLYMLLYQPALMTVAARMASMYPAGHRCEQRFTPNKPWLMLCHDAGPCVYQEDAQQGLACGPESCHAWRLGEFGECSQVDALIYFSHAAITVPPSAWSQLRRRGMCVLGTLIAEWGAGQEACHLLLEAWHAYAHGAVESSLYLLWPALLAGLRMFGMDGWLINLEAELPACSSWGSRTEAAAALCEAVTWLRGSCHAEYGPASMPRVVWYDSVTKDGVVAWQNTANGQNAKFAHAADMLFTNYAWQERSLQVARRTLSARPACCAVGIDVWARGCEGEWRTGRQIQRIAHHGLSAACFAPAWLYEHEGGSHSHATWWKLGSRWWLGRGQLDDETGVLQAWPHSSAWSLPQHTAFLAGCGDTCVIAGRFKAGQFLALSHVPSGERMPEVGWRDLRCCDYSAVCGTAQGVALYPETGRVWHGSASVRLVAQTTDALWPLPVAGSTGETMCVVWRPAAPDSWLGDPDASNHMALNSGWRAWCQPWQQWVPVGGEVLVGEALSQAMSSDALPQCCIRVHAASHFMSPRQADCVAAHLGAWLHARLWPCARVHCQVAAWGVQRQSMAHAETTRWTCQPASLPGYTAWWALAGVNADCEAVSLVFLGPAGPAGAIVASCMLLSEYSSIAVQMVRILRVAAIHPCLVSISVLA